MKKLNKKGQVGSYIVWLMSAIFIITIGAVVAPLGVNFNSQMYLAGEQILEVTQEDIGDIQDLTIKTRVNESIESAKNSAAYNIEINANLFQYSWVLFLIVSTMIIFLATRQSVEFQRRSGGLV